MLQFMEERRAQCKAYEQSHLRMQSVIDYYENGYKRLVSEIIENPNYVSKIKANIAEMVTNYRWAFELNHRELFYELKSSSMLAIMCLLMNEYSRGFYLPTKETIEGSNGSSVVTYDIEHNADKNKMYEEICRLTNGINFATTLGDNLRSYSKHTNGYWDDVEVKGKKYMIISMNRGNVVRAASEHGGDLQFEDIDNQFVILDGIDYKSASSTDQLRYMEV
jgi:hypothetical protein